MHADHRCKWGQNQQRTLSVSHCKFGGTSYQLPGMNSVSRKVKIWICAAKRSCAPRWYDSTVTGQEVCSMYCKCVCIWFIATVGLDWNITPIGHFIQQNPHHLTHWLAQIKPQAVQNVTTHRKGREGSRRGMFISPKRLVQINLHPRTKQIQAFIPVQETPVLAGG